MKRILTLLFLLPLFAIGQCDTVTGLTATGVGHASATISFTAPSATLYFVLIYNGTRQNINDPGGPYPALVTAPLNSLTPSTAYTYTIVRYCSGSDSAESSDYYFTTTAPPCDTVTNVAASVTSNSVSITSTAAAYGDSYVIYYVRDGQTDTTTEAGADEDFQLANLRPNTVYWYQIGTICGSDTTRNTRRSFTTSNSPAYTPSYNFGWQYKRLAPDSTLNLPTMASPSLRNGKNDKAAFIYDTTIGAPAVFNPLTQDWEYLLAGGSGSGDTVYIQEIIVDSIIVFRNLRLPFGDTVSAIKRQGYAIYDTILDHFYGYAGNAWACFDCTGAIALTGLSDVNISSVQDAQPLVYDNASSKWINNRLTGTGSKLLRANSSGQLGRVELSGLTFSGDTLYNSGTSGVTSVATNDGTGITGGTITTTGTLSIDTFNIATRLWRDKLADSLGAIISTKGTGTVTSVATNDATGVTGGTITGSGTIAIDTFNISTKLWLYKVADSLSRVVGPWKRDALSGASATSNIAQLRTLADTIVTGGTDVIGTTTSPLYKFNHSGNMGVFRNNIGTSITFGSIESIIARNTTAAALGAQQNSGMIALTGNAWNTTSSASQPVTFGLQVEPIQGSSVDGNFKIKRSLNGANYSDVATFSAGGNLTTSGANIYISPSSNGTLNASTFYSATGINQVLQTQSSGNTWSVVQGNNRPLNLYATTSNLIVTGGGVGTAPTDPSANFSVYRGAGAPINLHFTTSGSATVTGTSTYFTNTFRPGDNITISGTTRVVASVASNTSLTTTATWPSNVSNAGATTDARYAMQVRANGQVGIFGITSPSASLHIGAGLTAAQSAPIKLTTGAFMTTAESGAMEYTTPQLTFTNGTAIRQEIPLIQQKRVSTQFDKTSDVTLANITGLTADLAAGATYRFEATLYTSSANTGGVKFAIGGTATATNIIYEALVNDNNTNAAETRATALATTVGNVTNVTAGFCKINGTITVNAAGTLTLQFAQNNSDGTASSVLVGSTFVVTQIL